MQTTKPKNAKKVVAELPVKQDDRMVGLQAEAWERACAQDRRAHNLHNLSVALGIGATVLAAVAAITVLPADITKWVTGAVAFLAALVSGINALLQPEKQSQVVRENYVDSRALYDKVTKAIAEEKWGLYDALEAENRRQLKKHA